MKLKNTAKTFNLGDTSFRRKTLIDDYKTLLPFLQKNNLDFPEWNNESQAEFYKKILQETNLFSRNTEEDFSKRGRTLTNALVKIGLTNKKRKLSKVAINWLNGNTLTADSIEKVLGIDINNLLFARQLLKLRIYDSNGLKYFYPFRVAIELVKRYDNIPQHDFLTLIHLIQPNFSNSAIVKLIDNYQEVNLQNQSFAKFLNTNFPDQLSKVTADELFAENELTRNKFDSLFVNRKSVHAQNDYFEFVISLLKFKADKTSENLQHLLKIANNNKIKRAFGFGKTIFENYNNLTDFLEKNSNNILLSDNNSQIYQQFVLSKKDDLISEYSDLTKRTFNLSGLFDFSNGLVNATNQEAFLIIFRNMTLAGEEKYADYEQNLKAMFYQEKTITEILALDHQQILISIKKWLGVDETSQIENIIANQKELKFRKFIFKKFPRKKIIELLPLFSERKDELIKLEVSESATVSTIYEYIVAIAWFYISSEEFYLTKSFNLTLDGNMLPLSHAVGGSGDIIIDYENLTLMLEVTLMNSQAQKRGEWEPVLRHATNLTVDKYPKNVITLFIADKFDDNTVNIWRAVASVPLKSSTNNELAELVKIFPLKNSELLDLLKNQRDEKKLFSAIDQSYAKLSGNFNLGWRTEIFKLIEKS